MTKNRYEDIPDGTTPADALEDFLEPLDEQKAAQKADEHGIPFPERLQEELSEGENTVIDASDRFKKDLEEPNDD